MKKYVLCVSEGIKYWTLTSEENYKARIADISEIWSFDGANGFDSTEDVLAYIEKYFHISRENITIV